MYPYMVLADLNGRFPLLELILVPILSWRAEEEAIQEGRGADPGIS